MHNHPSGGRDLLKEQLSMEAEKRQSGRVEENRAVMAATCNNFIKAHDLFSDPANSALVSNMIDGALVQALEFSYRPAISAARADRSGEKAKPASADSALILSKRVIVPYEAPSSAAPLADAIATNTAESGRVELNRIASLLGKVVEEVKLEIEAAERPRLFKDPKTGAWESRNDYLTAHVKRKLNGARAARTTRVSRQHDGSHLMLPHKVPAAVISMRRNQKNGIWRGISERFNLFDHTVGAGKAQPLDAKILTPGGWKLMGDIQPGDSVISVDGTPTLVEAVFPQGEKEIFRVVFSDGSSTECCEEHLWETQTYKERGNAQKALKDGKVWNCGKGKVRPLAEIRGTLVEPRIGAKNHTITLVSPVQFNVQELPIAPYLMGALLGDGGFSHTGVTITSDDPEIIEHCQKVLPAGVKLGQVKTGSNCPTWTLTNAASIGRASGGRRNPLKASLAELGLRGLSSHDKFIPDIYLFNTMENRIELLRGLMDTDGSVSKPGHSSYFYTCSDQLAGGVIALVQSLGGTVRRALKNPTYRYKGELKAGRPCHVLCIKIGGNPFLLSRKADKVIAKTSYAPVRYFVAVEPVGRKLAQCIRVAHASHLYVTDDFIVTHNCERRCETASI